MDKKSKIIYWLKKKVKEAHAKGLIAGISGGIDSAVVAVLCGKAVGKKFLGLLMPCHSHKEDLLDAKDLAKKFKLKTKLVDLTNIYDLLVKRLPRAGRLSYANLKPRLRMMTLYYFANKFNYLVVGTGNKSEFMMGYFTKYGDGAVDLLPLGNLLKTQIRKLARELAIPEKIINKVPSAGLWNGQTDEQEMGLSYSELDDILYRLEKGKRQIVPAKKVGRVKKAILTSCHKRQIPEVFK